uniref:Uncharacterized protein n=1 Tax=Arundo donax TaxID=35708 RepID=A0A0A9CZL2_ARUDO
MSEFILRVPIGYLSPDDQATEHVDFQYNSCRSNLSGRLEFADNDIGD